jgi:DNA-binding NarL/FixJ family response regulator
MIALVQTTILIVGLDGRSKVLDELPVEVLVVQSGFEAARSLKNKKINGVVCKWDLDDAKDGEFLRRFRAVKPDVPTVALIRTGDVTQEITARSLGVSSVLPEETPDNLLRETVANILCLESEELVYAAKPLNCDNDKGIK